MWPVLILSGFWGLRSVAMVAVEPIYISSVKEEEEEPWSGFRLEPKLVSRVSWEEKDDFGVEGGDGSGAI